MHSHPTRMRILSLFCAVALTVPALAQVRIAGPGVVPAAIVTADDPSRMAAYAAEELRTHLAQATGAHFTVVTESAAPAQATHSRLFVGETAASRAAGLDSSGLGNDVYRLHTRGGDLFVLGREDADDDPMSERAASGTLYGVYEVLERFAGVRWLWPGALGTHVPHRASLVIPQGLDEQHAPKTQFRTIRWHRTRQAAAQYDARNGRLGFSEAGIQAYRDDLEVFLRRNRIGQTEPRPRVGHTFSGWWQRHGEDHPEWFMMREDGGRGPGPEPVEELPDWRLHHVAMNVANPDLHRFIVEEFWDGEPVLSLGEVDVRVFCQSPESRAWDVEAPPGYYPDLYRMGWDGEWNEPAPYDDFLPQAVSDRYARFWKTIHAMAAARNPEVIVSTYLYWNYFPAPLGDIQLHEGIYGEFVPWTRVTKWMPMPDQAFEWIKQQWLGWRDTGIRMAYRPNYFHGGYVMPQVSTWQAGEFLRFAYQNGMIGTDFDSLHGHWAVRGPMFYIHFRLFWNPEWTVEELRDEYFRAFGPAAPWVEAYFDHWERHAETVMVPLEPWPDSGLWSPARAHITYPEAAFAAPAAILEEGLEAAKRDANPIYAERVRFLAAGLEHARLSSRFMQTLVRGAAPVFDRGRFEAAQEALHELIAFRLAHEHLYIADTEFAAMRENLYCQIDLLFEEAEAIIVPSLEGHWGAWSFRADPDSIGVDEAWHAEREETGSWEVVDDPAHWPSAYQGEGWYRVAFTVPAEWEERPVTLLFEGISEQAWVYVNGALRKEHTMQSEHMPPSMLRTYPFRMVLAPGEVRYGAANTLVVRVAADAFPGGIIGPVSGFTLREDDEVWRASRQEDRVGG